MVFGVGGGAREVRVDLGEVRVPLPVGSAIICASAASISAQLGWVRPAARSSAKLNTVGFLVLQRQRTWHIVLDDSTTARNDDGGMHL